MHSVSGAREEGRPKVLGGRSGETNHLLSGRPAVGRSSGKSCLVSSCLSPRAMGLWDTHPWTAWCWELHGSVPQRDKTQTPHSLPRWVYSGVLGAYLPTKNKAGLWFGILFCLCSSAAKMQKNKLVWIDTKYISSHCSGSEQILICLGHLLVCKCLILNRAKGDNHKAAMKGLSSSSLSSSSPSSQVTWKLGYFTRAEKPRLASAGFHSQMLRQPIFYKCFMGAAIMPPCVSL